MFAHPPCINFLKYNGKSFSPGTVMMSRIQTTVQNFEVYFFFMQLTYDHFLKYYEKSFTVGSVMISRIQSTFQNTEVYYFYAAAI